MNNLKFQVFMVNNIVWHIYHLGLILLEGCALLYADNLTSTIGVAIYARTN